MENRHFVWKKWNAHLSTLDKRGKKVHECDVLDCNGVLTEDRETWIGAIDNHCIDTYTNIFEIDELQELRVQKFRSVANDNAIDGRGKHVPPIECLLQALARLKAGTANGGGSRLVAALIIALTMRQMFLLYEFS